MRTKKTRKKKRRSVRTAIFPKTTKKRTRKTTKNNLYSRVPKLSTEQSMFPIVLLLATLPFAPFAKGADFHPLMLQEPGQPPPPEPPAPSSSSRHPRQKYSHASDFLIRGTVFTDKALSFPGVELR